MQKATIIVICVAGGVLALGIIPGVVSKLETVQLPEIKNPFELGGTQNPESELSPELIYGNMSVIEIEYQRQANLANTILTMIPYVMALVIGLVVVTVLFRGSVSD